MKYNILGLKFKKPTQRKKMSKIQDFHTGNE